MSLRSLALPLVTGIPGGALIFMSMLMFRALLNLVIDVGDAGTLALLGTTSLVVGLLARLVQPYHGMGTAVASGLVAAALMLGLRLFSPASAAGDTIFTVIGMLITIVCCPLGAWLLPRLRKKP
jgi:hypothetical protein